MQQPMLHNNDMPLHKFIPMEKLDFIQPNQVKILYYQNPSRFYVYLRQKINSHAQFQVELQRAMQNYQSISSSIKYQRYQPVVAQDNHAVWHRATILEEVNSNSNEIRVYFVDVGQQENISITNIRPLPQEFTRQPAFAIPCRLYQICSRNSNDQSTWQPFDPVHDEFNRLMANSGSCKVCDIQEQLCYDVEIEIPQVGDLGTFLFGKNLVSRTTMRSSQATTYNATQPPPASLLQQQTFGRPPLSLPGIPSSIQQQRSTQPNEYYSNRVQQQQPTTLVTSGLQKPIVPQTPSKPTSTDSSSNIRTVPPQDGHYTITQVYSAVEFYGHSQLRERELDFLHKHLEDIYNNNNTNDQSLSVHFLMEGVSCAIQQGDKYHRVIIKHRESESRVSVKLIDRGDEIIVDTSELLQLEAKILTIPAFAQPFRLHDYDESSTANITRKLKRLILNQRVQIIQHLPMINGFYPVEVKLSNGQSVNQILLSNENIQLTSPPVRSVEVSTLKPQQDMNIQRSNDDLPAPQKILTATTSERTQPGRFGQTPPIVNEQTSRFSRPQQSEEPNNTQRPFERNASRVTNGTSQNRFNDNQQSKNEQSRPFSRGFTNEEQRNGNENNRNDGFADRERGLGRNNEENTNENGAQRSGGFTNRGGFADRGGRPGGFQDRDGANRNNQDDGNNDNQRSQGFASRGGGGGGFNGDRGNRNGGSQNYRDRGEDKEGGGDFARRGGFGGDRGGSRGGPREDRGGFGDRGGRDGGGFGDRGGRGGSFGDRGGRGSGFGDRGARDGGGFGDRGGRGGGFGDRGGRGGGFGDRGARGGGGFGDRGGRSNGFGDRDDNGPRSNSDNNDTPKSFSGWPNAKAPLIKFEAGDKFLGNAIPRETFQFVLSHIEKANDFFIQLLSKGDELSNLTDTLQSEYKEALEFFNFSSIKPNQACLAKSSDGCWYRAIVLSTSITKIKVRFIDFGDTTDVDTKTIRQLAKKFCSTVPYAYHCTLKNVDANENINTDNIIEKCAGKTFDGKLENQPSDDKYFLQSDNFSKLLIEINAIKIQSKDLVAHLKCLIVYNDCDKHQFYIQDDDETMQKITDLIHKELVNAKEVSTDDIKLNSMVISMFQEAPYRAVIQSDRDDDVNVYFVDFGNSNICFKSSLKQCSEQLQEFSHQAKRCKLYGVEFNNLDEAFKELESYIESEKVEIVIMNQNDDLCNVLVYIDGECFNKKFGYDDENETNIDMDDQSSIATTTTVQEQERPPSATGKRNNEEILSPVGNSLSAPMNTKRQKSESENEAIPIKHLQGTLTYIDKSKPFVYLQLIPESEPIVDRINELIGTIIQESKHNSSYEIGDYIIAKYSVDDNFYRAHIKSYSSSTENYTVYFLDYGNIDENVPQGHLYSYSTELQQIEPQAHGYYLENLTSQTWTDTVRLVFEDKVEGMIDFHFIDDIKSIIHIKLDHENEIYETNNNNSKPKTFTANISGTTKDYFYIHISSDADLQIPEMDELLREHEKQNQIDDIWSINDLCIVLNKEEDEYFRGKILSINNDKYNVQCIDYGNIIYDRINEDLYLLTDEKLLKEVPVARQCRLYGVSEKNQMKAIDEVIKYINQTEPVTITVENDQNDQCMSVMLFRENNDIVNDQYQDDHAMKKESATDKKDDIPVGDSSDSAIAADNDTSNDDAQLSTNGQQLTSPIGIPQAESTHQYGDTANNTVSNSSPSSTSITINQTIDFGENDPSTSNTTIKDDSENLSLE